MSRLPLPHGPGTNLSHRPRIAQYVSMHAVPTADDEREAARLARIRLVEERRAPEHWRGLRGQLDPEPGPAIALTELGRKLVGYDRWLEG